MKITVNGEAYQLQDNTSVQDLINQQELGGKRIAVEVNLDIVPRSQFANHKLNEGDKVEIVHAIGGG